MEGNIIAAIGALARCQRRTRAKALLGHFDVLAARAQRKEPHVRLCELEAVGLQPQCFEHVRIERPDGVREKWSSYAAGQLHRFSLTTDACARFQYEHAGARASKIGRR